MQNPSPSQSLAFSLLLVELSARRHKLGCLFLSALISSLASATRLVDFDPRPTDGRADGRLRRPTGGRDGARLRRAPPHGRTGASYPESIILSRIHAYFFPCVSLRVHFTRRCVFDRFSAHCPTPRRVYPRALLTAAHSRLRRSWPHLIPNRCSNRRRVPNPSRRVRTTIPFPSATGVRRWPRPLNVRWDRFDPTSGDHWCYTCGYSCSLVGRCFAMLLRVQSATASICGGSPSHRAGGRKGGYPEVAQNLGFFKCSSYRGAHAAGPAGWLVRRILVPKIAPLSMK